MSTSDSTVKGKFDELAGKAKQAFGDATGDQSTANSGATQQVKGNGEQAWGSVKEAAQDSTEKHDASATNEAHSLRDSITSGAANMKQRVENAADDFEKR